MKIAVTAQGDTLDSPVDPRFGRCAKFIVVDPDTSEFTVVDNSNINAAGGAGVASAQCVADQDVEAVLTGNCGPKAFRALNAAGIAVITGASGTVSEAINAYKDGALAATNGPSVQGHFGIN